VEVWARGQAETQAEGRAQELVRALAQVANGGILPPGAIMRHRYAPTYQEVLADSKIKDIIDSIDPVHRHRLARDARGLWRHPEHWWLIQIITPVTCLPPGLLQSNFPVIINDTSGPPLTLMLVCKHWYTIVTSIWASFKLGTKTSRDAVTKKLERNQWLLDIVVDTGTDRGDLTPSEGAYEAIFTACHRSHFTMAKPGSRDVPRTD